MRLSIIVPVYNVRPYLTRCIDSLCDQRDLQDYEIILVDDGSTDGSDAVCDAYAKKQDNIVVIHKENGGLSSARNAGLNVAKGEYILFVDSDDYVKSDSLAALTHCAEAHDLDVLGFDFLYVHGLYQVEANRQMPRRLDEVVTGERYLIDNLEAGTMLMIAWKNLYRRALLQEHQLYFREGYVHEDEEWTPRVLTVAQRVMHVSDIVYAYCVRSGSISSANHRKATLDLLDNCQNLKRFCQTLSNEHLKNLLENNIATLCLSAFYKGRLTDQTQTVSDLCDGLTLGRRNQKKLRLLRTSHTLYLLTNDISKGGSRLLGGIKTMLRLPRRVWSRLQHTAQKKLRHLFVTNAQRKRLENHTFSLLSSTCNGGVITSELGEQFRSPTINLWFEAKDFVRFVSRLEEYLAMELEEVANNFCSYPVGKLGEVTVYFMHYHSFEEAKRKWDERKRRIRFDNLFIMMAQRNGCDDETVAAFDALPYPNKVIFTAKEYPACPSAIYTPKYSDNGEVGILTDFVGLTKRKYDEYLDYVSWLNGKEGRI